MLKSKPPMGQAFRCRMAPIDKFDVTIFTRKIDGKYIPTGYHNPRKKFTGEMFEDESDAELVPVAMIVRPSYAIQITG